ncbi:ATP-binding cassette domain-containing protein [Paenibacillus sp. HB172176]|uniref:ATP-binding cassette domain-containing protein n=1 Tax=Paenibacillus sp. HB172176 TaxID=2493690 RepID=UPI001438A5BC|nr:ATP-binding cassette domain-containing protein [Paenibacillus sp. HB172176]
MKEKIIEVKGLHKAFGKTEVLSGLDLSVTSGSIFALLGPNGAGKTTLIHILSTLVAPDRGTAAVAGYNIASQRNEVKRSISLTGQFAAVDEVLTGAENLRLMCRLAGLSRSQTETRTAELLRQFDLEAAAGKHAGTYSGGMRRRLDLAVSLVISRPVLFLDEPTTGLDTISRRALWEIILQLKNQGMTIFLTTQYLEEADELADTIAVINGGRIVASGTAEELKAQVGGEVIELRDHQDRLLETFPTTGGISDVREAMEQAAARYPGDARISIRKPSMDDVFIALTTNQMEVSR